MDICRHDTPLSEHCWECDAGSKKAAVLAERERILSLIEAEIERTFLDAEEFDRNIATELVRRIREEST